MNIDGLQWRDNWRVENGPDSYVVPFPRLRPAQLVYHGTSEFSYQQYGVHLGQDDILTFLGPSTQVVKGHFLDCRSDSPTFGQRDDFEFSPTSARALVIPRGVGHDFDGLENVFTLNTYELYLPAPDDWVDSDWRPKGDVINVPSDVDADSVPALVPNSFPAGDRWYQLVGLQQRVMIPLLSHEYPVTKDVEFEDGQSHRVALLKRATSTPRPEWEDIDEIEGLGWVNLPFVSSGPESGFVPLLEPHPLYFIDHGETDYTHDAFGIHLGQEDHLLFAGPPDQTVTVEFIDTRDSSPTHGTRFTLEFQPDPTRYLKIPAGVGHALSNLQNVFTVNRAAVFLPDGESSDYRPGNDVIDWPRSAQDVPRLQPNTREAPAEFYAQQVSDQVELQKAPPMHATPAVMLIDGPDGEKIRVALRKRVDATV